MSSRQDALEERLSGLEDKLQLLQVSKINYWEKSRMQKFVAKKKIFLRKNFKKLRFLIILEGVH